MIMPYFCGSNNNVNYKTDFKQFISSHYIYSGIRIALAIVIPSVILAYFGLLKDYFLFPLGTSFLGLTDQPGPFTRRKNALLFALISFIFVAIVASLFKNFPILIFFELLVFGMFFSMIGVYGQRLASVGGMTLVVLAIFIDGHLSGDSVVKSLIIFLFGTIWYFFIYLIVNKLQPYKLASQMIGENYLDLSEFLRLKAKFYLEKPNFEALFTQIFAMQVKIKDNQEATREIVFKTRMIVEESTTTSRLLILLFLNAIDLHEKLMTSESDYKKLHQDFENSAVLEEISHYLMLLSDEISNIGIALQASSKAKPLYNIDTELHNVYETYFELRSKKMSADTLEDLMLLRIVLQRITQITDEIKTIYKVFSQDLKLAKSLSTGLDFKKFLPKEEKINFKVFKTNFTLNSLQFRHALRITIALLIGYGFSTFHFLGIGHAYWILITIVAIMRPAYSTTKHRNLLRLYGTVAGAVSAYLFLHFIDNTIALLFVLFISMIFCFTLLKTKYLWSVFFMTIYIFLTFNILNPGHVNLIFKDRIIDTAIGGAVIFLVTYFILPVWEHTQNVDFMRKSAKSNLNYFLMACKKHTTNEYNIEQYKVCRRNAIVDLANLSDNFQRMISDPKNQQKKLETIHQFVTTSHLITAYIASFSQYANVLKNYPEIDFESWEKKIAAELSRTIALLDEQEYNVEHHEKSKIAPSDAVEDLLIKRKLEITENEFYDRRDPHRITHLTEILNIKEVLELIYDVSKEQRKLVANYYKDQTTMDKQ